MVLRVLQWRGPRRLLLAATLVCLLSPARLLPALQAGKAEENVFDDRTAAQLVNQIADALVARNQKKMLEAFDVARMTDGPVFRQQLSSFFAQTGSIRVHFNLVEATMEKGQGVARVDAEMEASLRDDSLTPVRKQARLRFVAEKSAVGWKFIGVEPRTFFSTTQP